MFVLIIRINACVQGIKHPAGTTFKPILYNFSNPNGQFKDPSKNIRVKKLNNRCYETKSTLSI